jgi:ribonuclease BN (tRNA processing enzyme)
MSTGARNALVADLHVLGTGVDEGTGPTLLLALYKQAQYGDELTPMDALWFNCGECACRAANEQRIKLSLSRRVLLTRAAPLHTAGLPSLVFHLADGGAPALAIIGPAPATRSYVGAVQSFVQRQFPAVEVHDPGDGLTPLTTPDDVATRFYWARAVDEPRGSSGAPEAGAQVTPIVVWNPTLPSQARSHADGAHPGRELDTVPAAKRRRLEAADVAAGAVPARFGVAANGVATPMSEATPAARSPTAAVEDAIEESMLCYRVRLTGPVRAADAAAAAAGGAGGRSSAGPTTRTRTLWVLDCPSLTWLPALQAALARATEATHAGVLASSASRTTSGDDDSDTDTDTDSDSDTDSDTDTDSSSSSDGDSSGNSCGDAAAPSSRAAERAAPDGNHGCIAWGADDVVVHLGPPHVTGSQEYAAWCRSGEAPGGKSACHVNAASSASVLGRGGTCALPAADRGQLHDPSDPSARRSTHFPAALRQACRLHAADPFLFPLPVAGDGAAEAADGDIGAGILPGLLQPLTRVRVFGSAGGGGAGHMLSTAGLVPVGLLLREAAAGLPPIASPEALAAALTPAGATLEASMDAPSSTTAHDGMNRAAAAALRASMLTAGRAGSLAAEGKPPQAATGADQSVTLTPYCSPVTPANTYRGPQLVLLGTGAAAPSKQRSCSSIYVRLSHRDSGIISGAATSLFPAASASGLLLDVGEGCLMRLGHMAAGADHRRGSTVAAAIGHPSHAFHGVPHRLLAGIRLVWVSHMHADHHTGLLTLLLAHAAARVRALASGGGDFGPLRVVGPRALADRLLPVYARMAMAALEAEGPVAIAAGCQAGSAGTARRLAPLYTFAHHDSMTHATGLHLAPEPDATPALAAAGRYAAGTASDSAHVEAEDELPPGVEGAATVTVPAAPFAAPLVAAPASRWGATLQSVPVEHCRDAWGAVLTLAPPAAAAAGELEQAAGAGPVVVAYSGDTRPCGRFAEVVAAAACRAAASASASTSSPGSEAAGGAGRGSVRAAPLASAMMVPVLVLHEATFNDDRAADAVKKRHSTVGEALGVAARVAQLCARALRVSGPLAAAASLVHGQAWPGAAVAPAQWQQHARMSGEGVAWLHRQSKPAPYGAGHAMQPELWPSPLITQTGMPTVTVGALLTHFSQRYPAAPIPDTGGARAGGLLSAPATSTASNAGAASDISSGNGAPPFLCGHDGMTLPLWPSALAAVFAAATTVTARMAAALERSDPGDGHGGGSSTRVSVADSEP